MPQRNTTGNSRPLAVCSVIICTQSSHSSAWPSPDSSTACARNASSGGSSSASPPSGSKPRAALTSSSRFSTRASPRSGLVLAVMLDQPARSGSRDRPARAAAGPRSRASSRSISARKPCTAPAPPCAPERPPLARCRRAAASHSEVPAPRAYSRSTSSALRADAARRQVDDALERGIVVAVGDQAQVGERVLDFRALEEPQAAVHAVRNARRQERFFEHARLRVGAVQDRRSRAARRRCATHSRMRCDHEVGFVALVEGGVEADRLALARRWSTASCRGGRCCWRSARWRPRGCAGGAVVLLQPEELRLREIAAELLQVLDPRAAPAVDRLIVVADHERDCRRRAPASSLIQAYWMAFVSWNSSTSTCRKRCR